MNGTYHLFIDGVCISSGPLRNRCQERIKYARCFSRRNTCKKKGKELGKLEQLGKAKKALWSPCKFDTEWKEDGKMMDGRILDYLAAQQNHCGVFESKSALRDMLGFPGTVSLSIPIVFFY